MDKKAFIKKHLDTVEIQPQKKIEKVADIETAFAAMQNRNEMAEVLKELFDEQKIYMIGDMSKDEIKLATRIYMIASIKKIDVWFTGLAFYTKFLISKDRKSRSEILRAIAGYQQPQGLLNKLGGGFNRDRGY